MSNFKKIPYLRDVYFAFLTKGAKRTKTDGYPIMEKWMVIEEPPKYIVQWNRRSAECTDKKNTAICFYCNDEYIVPCVNKPDKYIDTIKSFNCFCGLDLSPYDNMPLWIQKSQIGINISFTYYYGSKGIKIIPNVRLGNDLTVSSLEAYPHHTLICIGTNGFVFHPSNRAILTEQIKTIVDVLEPTGICVYGPTLNLFSYAINKGIKIYQYDSSTMIRNKRRKDYERQ